MANRRMISSTTWRDEFIGSITFFERCLWIGLFSTCADDQGRLVDNPILIRGDIFPYDDIPASDIETGIVKFEQEKKIQRYQVKGKKYIQILRWWENQRPQWAARSKYPAPNCWIDRIRTRENGKYFIENWLSSCEDIPNQSHEEKADVQAGGQYPVPVPIPIPVKYPVTDNKDSLSPPPNFISEFVTAVRVQFTNGDQPSAIKDMAEDYGEDIVLQAATWYGQNNPQNMGHAIKSLTTVLGRGWNTSGKKNGKVNIEAVLAEMMEEELDGK